MAKILIKFNEAVIKEYPLTKDETTFGRKEGNDIAIDHPSVSGFHGKIVKEGDQFFVVDLNSTNGTFINGRKISKSSIQNKDHIRVAKHVLEFYTDDAVEAAETAEPQPSEPSEPPTPPDPVEAQKEMLRKSLGVAEPKKPVSPKPKAEPAKITIISGAIDAQTEFFIKDLVTYIGTSEKATIKIKGFLAPDLAAAISRKPEGYFLQAIKEGYPKVNGAPIKTQTLLDNGSMIECGGTNMVFYDQEAKRKADKSKKIPTPPAQSS